jgi:hypothetical protein
MTFKNNGQITVSSEISRNMEQHSTNNSAVAAVVYSLQFMYAVNRWRQVQYISLQISVTEIFSFTGIKSFQKLLLLMEKFRRAATSSTFIVQNGGNQTAQCMGLRIFGLRMAKSGEMQFNNIADTRWRSGSQELKRRFRWHEFNVTV